MTEREIMRRDTLKFLQTARAMGIEKVDPERYLHFAVNRLTRKGRDRDFLIKAMLTYADLRIAEYLEAEQREAAGADIYAAYQQSLPLNAPAGAAGVDAGA